MDAATQPGDGLMFVRGLSRDDIDRLCERYDAAVAIVNPGDAFVIGGDRAALQAIAAEAKAMHAAQGGGPAGGGRFPYAAARRGLCGISRELAPDVT